MTAKKTTNPFLAKIEQLKKEAKDLELAAKDHAKLVEANKAFARASQANKIVMIGKDVLAQLAAKKYVAESGCYERLNTKEVDDLDVELDSDADFREEILSKVEKCDV